MRRSLDTARDVGIMLAVWPVALVVAVALLGVEMGREAWRWMMEGA